MERENAYEPGTIEPKWQQRWEEEGLHRSDIDPSRTHLPAGNGRREEAAGLAEAYENAIRAAIALWNAGCNVPDARDHRDTGDGAEILERYALGTAASRTHGEHAQSVDHSGAFPVSAAG